MFVVYDLFIVMCEVCVYYAVNSDVPMYEISNNQSSYILITMRQHCHTSVYITNEEIGHVVLHNLLLLL